MTLHLVDVRLTCLINITYLLTYHHFSSLNVLEMSPVLTRSRVLAAKTMLDALPSPICSHARREAATIAKPATLPDSLL